MKRKILMLIGFVFITGFLVACGKIISNQTPEPVIPPSPSPSSQPVTITPTLTPTQVQLSIMLGTTNVGQGLSLDEGGDVDTRPVQVGSPTVGARQSGNGAALAARDGNTVADSYFQFKVADSAIYQGSPTGHVSVEVDYLDQGTDRFSIEYDAQPRDGSTGLFYGGGAVVKTGSGEIRTAVFNLCNAYFANRDNGADFRIADNGDGAETILAVRVKGLTPGAGIVRVDDFGADPFDYQPDSDAIQAALDSTCSGDTVIFTSGVGTGGYQGYLIDKTLFLTGTSAKQDLTFTSSDPSNHALLIATADLKGFVVRLFARSRFSNPGDIDNIDFGNIDIDGGRDQRVCLGSNNVIDGVDDNWGSWLPECSVTGDPWCSPGNLAMDGGADYSDPAQDYEGNPGVWTTGVVVHDIVDRQAECGTAFSLSGAEGTIRNVTIDTAGDHVHAIGCALTDNDGDAGGWSDGITLFGPGHLITGNTIINPSDVGIAFFGGMDVVISNNTIQITSGNYGAFGAIVMGSGSLSDLSGDQIIGNTITSEGDSRCGGLHAGIVLGGHMWGGWCAPYSTAAMVGNPTCSIEPLVSDIAPCLGGRCQVWSFVQAGSTFTLEDNVVTGAQINYLLEGMELLGELVDQNNISQTPRLSDWDAARRGCDGITWGAMDKVAHHVSLPGWTDLRIHCER